MASLTPAVKEESDHAVDWSDELGDDVVTLSYERALRNHARQRPSDDFDLRLPAGADAPASGRVNTVPAAAGKNEAGAATQADTARRATPSCDLRTSSVTIRLSNAECMRLRQRAMEAGMTISAYLRSCVLEADDLRAQVKTALAEMRKAGAEPTKEQGDEKTQWQGSEEAREPGSSGTGSSWLQRLLRPRK